MCTRFYVEPDTEEIREIIAEVLLRQILGQAPSGRRNGAHYEQRHNGQGKLRCPQVYCSAS